MCRKIRNALFWVFFCLVVVFVLFFGRVVVDGNSMKPTYESGNSFIISKVLTPKRGDIVVFRRKTDSGKSDVLVKRVIALPGDTIMIYDGVVYVNNEPIDEPYIKTKEFVGGAIENTEIILNSKEYFVMGDNRNNSVDSRYFGCIKDSDIIGVEVLNLW